MGKFPAESNNPRTGFALIELLVVITIISVLTAIMSPVLIRVKVHGRVARVQVELQGIQRALEMYRDDWNDYPLAVMYSEKEKQDDYLEVPPPLYKLHYIGAYRIYDPFNPGHTYKYIAPGFGWKDGKLSPFCMNVPMCGEGAEGCTSYSSRDTCPLKWAIWSVGPAGNIDISEHERRNLPVPRLEWFPYKDNGVIVRLSNGRISP